MSKAKAKTRLAFEWDPKREVLIPSDAFALEIAKLELPARVRLNITWTRAQINDQKSKREAWNGWYWAGLGCFVDNHEDPLGRWVSTRGIHETIMEALGLTHKVWTVQGTYKNEVDSVKFTEMPDEEFFAYFERARAYMVGEFGWDPWDAWAAEKQYKDQLARWG